MSLHVFKHADKINNVKCLDNPVACHAVPCRKRKHNILIYSNFKGEGTDEYIHAICRPHCSMSFNLNSGSESFEDSRSIQSQPSAQCQSSQVNLRRYSLPIIQSAFSESAASLFSPSFTAASASLVWPTGKNLVVSDSFSSSSSPWWNEGEEEEGTVSAVEEGRGQKEKACCSLDLNWCCPAPAAAPASYRFTSKTSSSQPARIIYSL